MVGFKKTRKFRERRLVVKLWAKAKEFGIKCPYPHNNFRISARIGARKSNDSLAPVYMHIHVHSITYTNRRAINSPIGEAGIVIVGNHL